MHWKRLEAEYPRSAQRGAVAIEFVFVLPLALMLIYAVISYSVVFLYQQSLTSLSAEAARAAVAIYTAPGHEADSALINQRVTSIVDGSWIARERMSGCDEGDMAWVDSGMLNVCIETPMPVPVIGWGNLTLPFDPQPLQGRAQVIME